MPDPTSLQSRKQELVRSAIWDAAIDLFAEKGFNETTVDDIAQAAGVSRRSFFRYFSSKNDLMAQGILFYQDALTDAIRACPRNHSPLETVHHTVLQVASRAAAQPRTLKIMRISSSHPEARQAQMTRFAALEDSVAASFAARTRSRSAGKPSKDDITPRLLAGLTVAILDVTFRTWFLAHSNGAAPDISVTVEQAFRTLRRLVNNGHVPRAQARLTAP